MKRALSILLSVVMTFTFVCGSVTANAEESAPSAAKSVIENEYSVTGTNSFGKLLSGEISDEMDKQEENNGCNVFSAEVAEKTVTVDYQTTRDCTLLAAVYDDEGKQMLASGTAEVTADEDTAEVVIETNNMPEYFYLRVFMIDTYTLKPMCTVYQSPNYTKAMQEFFAKTVDDFDEEQVLNLDNDDTNNFAVFSDGVKIIDHSDTVNTVKTADEEKEYYVFENADESLTSLKSGDTFTYQNDDGTLLIVKIGEISADGDTVTVTGQETDMEEVFQYVKIDTTKIPDEPAPKPKPQSIEADEPDSAYMYDTEYQAWADVDAKCKVSAGFNIFETKVGSENLKTTLSGKFEMSVEATLKLYISTFIFWGSYLELKVDYQFKTGVELSGKGKFKIPINVLPDLVPFAGVSIRLSPSFLLEADAKLSSNFVYNGTYGFRVSTDDGYKDLTKTNKPHFETKLEGKIFIGLEFGPSINLISENIAKIELKAHIGLEIKGTMKPNEGSSDKKVHECLVCLDGDISIKGGMDCKIKLLKRIEFNIDILEFKVKLGDFYYSSDKNEFGWGSCPYYKYRITVTVKDKENNPVPGAEVSCWGKLMYSGVTDDNGKLVLWLPDGNYTFLTNIGEDVIRKRVEIYGEEKNVVLSPENSIDTYTSSPKKPRKRLKAVQVSCGGSHTALVTNDGSLYTWGYNTENQLGNGTNENSYVPVKILDNVKCAEVYHWYSLALTNDGNVYTWGVHYNGGDLADGIVGVSDVPIKVLDDVRTISAGGEHFAAIKNDGTLYTWGFNDCGRLGDGTEKNSSVPIKVLDNVKAVSLGQVSSAAVTEDGSLYTWGHNGGGALGNGTAISESLLPVKIMDNVRTVSFGTDSCAAITNDGELYTWGANNEGQLGNGTNENSNVPVKIMDNVRSVSMGEYTGAAITNDGSLYTWGNNLGGALGNGTYEDSYVPVKIMDNVSYVSIGRIGAYYPRAAAITNDGNLYVWGNHYLEELGHGENNDDIYPTPVKVNLPYAYEASLQADKYFSAERTENFTELTPDETYNFYILKPGSESLSPENLLYISQEKSDSKGNLSVHYIPREDFEEAVIFVKSMSSIDISEANVTVPDIKCDGSEQFAAPAVAIEGTELIQGKDYDIAGEYSGILPGEYNINIVGLGEYSGKISAGYSINCEHSFNDGKCEFCGSIDSTKGDVNGDNAVGIADLVALQKYLTNKIRDVAGNADVNGDDTVNAFDAVLLRRIILEI